MLSLCHPAISFQAAPTIPPRSKWAALLRSGAPRGQRSKSGDRPVRLQLAPGALAHHVWEIGNVQIYIYIYTINRYLSNWPLMFSSWGCVHHLFPLRSCHVQRFQRESRLSSKVEVVVFLGWVGADDESCYDVLLCGSGLPLPGQWWNMVEVTSAY